MNSIPSALYGQPREVNIWHDPNVSCPCVSDHNPNPVSYDKHHILPLSWEGQDTEDNIIILCPTAHRNVHDLLRHYARIGGTPEWDIRKHFSPFIRDLAEQAWRLYLAGTDINLEWGTHG